MDLFLLAANIKLGDTFTVECKIKSLVSDESDSLRLLFDTGASHTAICKKVLIDRGYTVFSEGINYRQTANGMIKLRRCEIREFGINGFVLDETFKVDVVESDFAGFHGLLGMNYIGKLETWISRSRAQAHFFGGFPKFANYVLDLTK